MKRSTLLYIAALVALVFLFTSAGPTQTVSAQGAPNMVGFSWDASVTQAAKRKFAKGVLGYNGVFTVNGKALEDGTLTVPELETAAAPYLYADGKRMSRSYYGLVAEQAARATSDSTIDSTLP